MAAISLVGFLVKDGLSSKSSNCLICWEKLLSNCLTVPPFVLVGRRFSFLSKFYHLRFPPQRNRFSFFRNEQGLRVFLYRRF